MSFLPSGSTSVMARRVEPPEIVSRADAAAAGQRWYFTGEPCPKGHVAKRTVSNRECRRCVDERGKQKRAEDPAPFRAREKTRYHQDPAKSRAQVRASRERNIEARREYDRRRYHENPERNAEARRRAGEWWKSNRGKANFMVARRRAWIKRATPAWLTAEQRRVIKVAYQIASELSGEWHVDHVDPLRGEIVCGLHVPWNLQILPGDENRRKSNVFAPA